MQYNKQQLQLIVSSLVSGKLGGFAAYIGDALSVADKANTERLVNAFPELMALALATEQRG
jgi:hypothetical protein